MPKSIITTAIAALIAAIAIASPVSAKQARKTAPVAQVAIDGISKKPPAVRLVPVAIDGKAAVVR